MKGYIFGEKWEPELSSLNTCFVNASLVRFGVEYRRYYKEEMRGGVAFLDPDDLGEVESDQCPEARPSSDPAVIVIGRDELERALAVAKTPREKMILIRTAQGFTQNGIANYLGISEKTVSSTLQRLRKRMGGRCS
jgi:DNA-binding CsgD family transcriptional regulator